MTSTNIFMGLSDEGKNSSRVLRPPGGGQTDVLGIGAQPEVIAPKKGNPRNVSSIMEGTNQLQVSPAKPEKQAVVEPPAPQEKSTPAEPVVDNKPTRVGRVPPGGFSQGLW